MQNKTPLNPAEKRTLSKYLFNIAFRTDLEMHGTWFALDSFLFQGPYLYNFAQWSIFLLQVHLFLKLLLNIKESNLAAIVSNLPWMTFRNNQFQLTMKTENAKTIEKMQNRYYDCIYLI